MTRLRLLQSRLARSRFLAFVAFVSMFLTMLPLLHVRAAGKETDSTSSGTSRTPVLVELFTSEGCSSCPPADALLQKLDRSQPAPNANLVVLSEHVDYWNDGGWNDPYSAREFSIRQRDYAQRFRLDGPYTPQMIVDGSAQLVGSDEHQTILAAEGAAKVAKLPVVLSAIRLEGANTVAVHIEVSPSNAFKKPPSGQVWLALADESDQSHVRHGENGGRTLTHVAVVRDLAKVGALDRSGAFSGDAKVDVKGANIKNLRVVAFVQENNAGRVVGVAMDRLSD
jgi:hypothetical protein